MKIRSVGELKMYLWDMVEDCRGEDCEIYRKCPHKKENECGMQREYLDSLIETVLKGRENSLDEIKLYQIGTELLPLYKLLCKLKIREMGVGSVVKLNNRGQEYMDPIYKEIRDTVKMITVVWSSLQLDEVESDELPEALRVVK